HARGCDPNDVMIAKYALCGTADDIVQNLPGADRDVWIQYSMVARFFQRRDSGVGFFQEAEKAMSAPAQKFSLLELMLVCLSLGFEGQYRALPHGSQELARIRTAIYDSLRRVAPRPDNDMSLAWQPVEVGGRRRFRSTPVWVIAAIAAALLVLAYGTLSTLIARDGANAVTTLTELHPSETIVALERSPGPAFVARIGQVERIREALAPEIAAGQVEVGPKGNFIYIRVGNALLFGSGSAELNQDFRPLADRIAAVLNTEEGPIAVIGFTDSIQPNGLGRYKTNQALSEARANSVRDVLAERLNDPARLAVEGRGPAEPIATNETREGRALNRRVEVMLAREGTF
ncbi:MAG: type VI secretion system protein TssL, long form, partial [Pseudomonadota bacterium]